MNLTLKSNPRSESMRAVRPAKSNRLVSGRLRDVIVQVVGLLSALGLYLAVRAISAGSNIEAVQNASRLLRFEGAIGIDVEGSMQKTALGADRLITAANWFYSFAYWPMIIATFVYTWTRHPRALRSVPERTGLFGAHWSGRFRSVPGGSTAVSRRLCRHGQFGCTAQLHCPPVVDHQRERGLSQVSNVGWLVLSAALLSPLSRRWIVKLLLTCLEFSWRSPLWLLATTTSST